MARAGPVAKTSPPKQQKKILTVKRKGPGRFQPGPCHKLCQIDQSTDTTARRLSGSRTPSPVETARLLSPEVVELETAAPRP